MFCQNHLHLCLGLQSQTLSYSFLLRAHSIIINLTGCQISKSLIKVVISQMVYGQPLYEVLNRKELALNQYPSDRFIKTIKFEE